MTNKRSKTLNGIVGLLIVALQTPFIIKGVSNIVIVKNLLKIVNLNELFNMSVMMPLQYEFLFKLGMVFSDLNFTFQKVFSVISLFDLLPILAIILLFEINRITKKLGILNNALYAFLILYLLKYIGVFIIVITVFTKGISILIGLKYLSVWLLIITFASFACIVYLIYSYQYFVKSKDY